MLECFGLSKLVEYKVQDLNYRTKFFNFLSSFFDYPIFFLKFRSILEEILKYYGITF